PDSAASAPRPGRRPAGPRMLPRLPAQSACRARSSQQRSLAGVEEGEQRAHVLAALRQRLQLRARFLEPGPGHVQGLVGAADRGDPLGIEAAPLQPFHVDPARAAVAFLRDQHERRHVAVDERAHADERMRADPAALVHAGEPAEDHLVADLDVAGEGGVVGEHAAVADLAVVGDVHVGQQPVVVADPGDAAAVAGAAVDGGELADHVAVADHQLGALAFELLVLRVAADGGMAMDAVVAADPGWALDAAMGADGGAVADLDVGPDQGERPDRHAGADPRGRIDDGAGMDAGSRAHLQPFASAHRISAQATCLPSTLATPSNSAMLRIMRLSLTQSSRRSPGTTMLLNFAL